MVGGMYAKFGEDLSEPGGRRVAGTQIEGRVKNGVDQKIDFLEIIPGSVGNPQNLFIWLNYDKI